MLVQNSRNINGHTGAARGAGGRRKENLGTSGVLIVWKGDLELQQVRESEAVGCICERVKEKHPSSQASYVERLERTGRQPSCMRIE